MHADLFICQSRCSAAISRYPDTISTLDALICSEGSTSFSLVVSRGCPHACDFCYKESFFQGGKSFYTRAVDDALAEINRLPGRHLYFLDDHLFGNARFAAALFDGMRGMGRMWQAAGTVQAVLRTGLLEKAAACGLRSLFVGFETLSASNLRAHHKNQNLGRDYSAAIRRLHDLGIMVNASFVFGMDDDDETVFDRTVVGHPARGRNGHLSHSHAIPWDKPVRQNPGRRADNYHELGSIKRPVMINKIYGLGGRDYLPSHAAQVLTELNEIAKNGRIRSVKDYIEARE